MQRWTASSWSRERSAKACASRSLRTAFIHPRIIESRLLGLCSPSMRPPPVRLHGWDEIALEKVTEMLSRKIITGEREMLNQIYLKRGCRVPNHSRGGG